MIASGGRHSYDYLPIWRPVRGRCGALHQFWRRHPGDFRCAIAARGGNATVSPKYWPFLD